MKERIAKVAETANAGAFNQTQMLASVGRFNRFGLLLAVGEQGTDPVKYADLVRRQCGINILAARGPA